MESHRTHSESLAPPPHILALPDELLLHIFSAVKSWRPGSDAPHADHASSSRDIASARLACRRFAATSSHLLVHHVRLDGVSARSLRRLEAVSRHPLAARGVRAVRLEALYYAPALADSAEAFAWYAINRAYERAWRYRQLFEAGQAGGETDGGEIDECEQQLLRRRAEAGLTLERVKVVLKAWSCMNAGDAEGPLQSTNINGEVPGGDDIQTPTPDNEDARLVVQYVRALRSAHKEYQLRYREQENLRKDKAFIKRFAAAMARMPRAKSLEILDFQHKHEARSGNGDELARLLDVASLARPICWADGLARQLGSPPVELLSALPTEIQRAGGRLDSIAVQTTVPAEQYYPLLGEVAPDEYDQLGAAVSLMGVRSFSFLHGSGPAPEPSPARATPTQGDVGSFLRYLGAMASGDGLERLRVRVDSGWADGSLDPGHHHAVGLGGILLGSVVSRPKLTDVHMENFPLQLSDVENLSSYMEQPGRHGLEFLTLSRTNLVTGTWAQALGILRRMRSEEKELMEPLGAEFTDSDVLGSAWYEKTFCAPGPGQRSVAERYINQELEHNPLGQDWRADLVHSADKEEVGGIVVGETTDGSELIETIEPPENIGGGAGAGLGTEDAA